MIFPKTIQALLNMLPHLGIYFLQNLLFLLNRQFYFMAQNLQVSAIHISISDERFYAVATVILES